MKRSNTLVLAVLVICAIGLSSYESGPAHHSGYNCTGSETDFSNPVGCSTGSCHGNTATPGIVVAIEVDSLNGGAISKYVPGQTYTVKLTGTNTTSNTDAKFGFQLTAIAGSAPAAIPVNAGTWQQTNLPSGVQYSPAVASHHLANVVEHSTALSPLSGTGGTGTVYQVSVNWTAPAAGTGTVSFWAALNAVIGFDIASGLVDFWNTQSFVLEEDTATTTGIKNPAGNMQVNVYPNPTNNFIHVELVNPASGDYALNVFNAEGLKISVNTLESNGSFVKTSLNTSTWAAGIYLLQLINGNEENVIKVVKR